jgi:hypothetical protein
VAVIILTCPHIYFARARGADGNDLALLQYPQQLCLHRCRRFAYFVEEEGSARRGFEETSLVLRRAREGATAVAEELALDNRLREGGTTYTENGASARALSR